MEELKLLALQKESSDLTHGLALTPVTIASAERFKSLFVHAEYTGKHCFLTINVHNKCKNAIVIPKVRSERDSGRKASQFFHSCHQRVIGSRRGGAFCKLLQ